MRKNIHFGLALAIILALSLLSYAVVSWESDAVGNILSHDTVSAPAIVISHAATSTLPADIKTFTFDLYAKGDAAITVEYPVLKPGYASAEITAKIKKEIASSAKADFQASISDLQGTIQAEADTGSSTVSASASSSAGTTASGNPDSAPDDNLYFSESVDPASLYANASTHVFSYDASAGGYSGGAHDGHYFVSYTYDTESGSPLSLGDFLKGDYYPAISTYIQGVISKVIVINANVDADPGSATSTPDCINCERLEADPDHTWWNQELKPENFVLSADGITFLFSDYELGPYVDSAGGQEIFVPKSALQAYVKRSW